MAWCLAIILCVCRGRAAAVMRGTAGTRPCGQEEKLPRSSGKNWQSCLLSSATLAPAPAQLARAPAPISHTLAGTQVGGRREDGGTLIWFLPRFEFKLERGGGWGGGALTHWRDIYTRFFAFSKNILLHTASNQMSKIFNFLFKCVFHQIFYLLFQLIFVYRMWT